MLFVGWLLVHYDLLSMPGATRGSTVALSAMGQKSHESRGDEVWFYGAFDPVSGRRLGDAEIQVPSGWEARGTAYVAFGKASLPIQIRHSGAVRLELGSHPYSGIACIASGSFRRTVDLYSNSLGGRSIEVPAADSIAWSPLRVPVLLLFFVGGCLLPLLPPRRTVRAEVALISVLTLSLSYLVASAFYPGVYTVDAMGQMKEALTGRYADAHPPMMAWIWSGLIALTGRMESMFVFHSLLMAAGGLCWVLVFARAGAPRCGLVVPLLLISPVVANFSGVVWKDVGFASATLLASALAVLATTTTRGRGVLVGAALLLSIYAIGVRWNGALALVPVFFACVISYGRRWPVSMKIGGALAVAVLVWGAVVVTTTKVINPERRNYAQFVQAFDLIGVSILSRRSDLYPPALEARFANRRAELERVYDRAITVDGSLNRFLEKRDDGWSLIPWVVGDPRYARELQHAWFEAMVREPWAYLKHRATMFGMLMSWGTYWTEQPQPADVRANLMKATGIDPALASFAAMRPPGASIGELLIEKTRVGPSLRWLYRGWLWLLVATLSFVAGCLLVKNPVLRLASLVLTSSALLYLAPYTLLTPASDFRYLYWTVIATAFSMALVLASGLEKVFRRTTTGVALRASSRPEPRVGG